MSTVSLDAQSISTGALPLIDITGLWSPDRADWESVGQALREACLNKGFLYLKGHGVSADLRAKVFDEAQSFFDLSINQKKKSTFPIPTVFAGMSP
jgi:isopenicillin N synthase-like dioxygenase